MTTELYAIVEIRDGVPTGWILGECLDVLRRAVRMATGDEEMASLVEDREYEPGRYQLDDKTWLLVQER